MWQQQASFPLVVAVLWECKCVAGDSVSRHECMLGVYCVVWQSSSVLALTGGVLMVMLLVLEVSGVGRCIDYYYHYCW